MLKTIVIFIRNIMFLCKPAISDSQIQLYHSIMNEKLLSSLSRPKRLKDLYFVLIYLLEEHENAERLKFFLKKVKEKKIREK